ncbi:hypothetical protein F2Q68_00022414 [Brassica cretica]|uniref:ZF-HD dimerization-type domain-containing protein n=1 Tax=Brassica cretica TaxID=69181 RepID=A0A8S9FTW0_BRACR|nr:hypothetical protein F2Q68_00022414 [Brassica cretica]
MESASIRFMEYKKITVPTFWPAEKKERRRLSSAVAAVAIFVFMRKKLKSEFYSYGRSAATVNYGECVKNHAPQTGGSWVDGCGEFVAAGEEGTPEARSCAACGCHRSFHKKKNIGN